GAARVHGMGRIAQQRDAAEGPARHGVLVHHRVLEDVRGARNQGGNVEPVKTPVLEDVREVLRTAGLVPVVHGRAFAPNLGDPIHQLVALPVDVVGDGIDHHLAGLYGADAQVAFAAEDGTVHRNAAPGIDP